MRVFVALACPDELLPVIARYRALVSDVPEAHMLDDAGLHMTMIKPWEEKDPDAVIRDFAAITSPPVTVTFNEVFQNHHDSHAGSSLQLRAPSTPKLERLWLQTWRALWSQNPPGLPVLRVTFVRFPDDAHLPAVPTLGRVTVTFDRLCLYESQGNLTYRIIGEKTLA